MKNDKKEKKSLLTIAERISNLLASWYYAKIKNHEQFVFELWKAFKPILKIVFSAANWSSCCHYKAIYGLYKLLTKAFLKLIRIKCYSLQNLIDTSTNELTCLKSINGHKK